MTSEILASDWVEKQSSSRWRVNARTFVACLLIFHVYSTCIQIVALAWAAVLVQCRLERLDFVAFRCGLRHYLRDQLPR
jgi:hypothetical protein